MPRICLTVTLQDQEDSLGHLSRLPGRRGTAFGLEGQLRLRRLGSAPAPTEKKMLSAEAKPGHSERRGGLLCPGEVHLPMRAAGNALHVRDMLLSLSRTMGWGRATSCRGCAGRKGPCNPPACLTLQRPQHGRPCPAGGGSERPGGEMESWSPGAWPGRGGGGRAQMPGHYVQSWTPQPGLQGDGVLAGGWTLRPQAWHAVPLDTALRPLKCKYPHQGWETWTVRPHSLLPPPALISCL